jgi:hypothetical protein
MTVERNQIGREIWVVWVFLSTMGIFIGFFMGFILVNIILGDVNGRSVLGEILEYSILGAGLGSVVGLGQWLILRDQISRAGWWILASAAGFAVAGGGYVAAVGAFSYSEGLEGLGSFAAVLGWTVVGALGGAVAGILQWLVLRRQVSRAGWWVLASTVGWGLSMAVLGALFYVELVGLLVGGAVLGAVTGGALVWLLRQPVPEV